MIQEQTILNVADNSGAKKVLCIKVLGGSKKKYGYIGDIIKIAVKSINSKSKIKKGSVLNAVIIRTKNKIYRKLENIFIKFDDNSCILLNENKLPIGTRIFGPIPKELRNKNFNKIISLSEEII
ncbi:50S ribosomal protein L14 [Candidatus Nardonella dryophthoridicola]|uniref:Large ribosomal subunit protein uL14 n=1 Tax=endosymbiont of Metamasius hemipterus TaxID=204627 RepID=A0ABT0TWD4_9GAMM|nr:50S ribosomal protein L14 [Candidatus Nardonella dryophthoridicola]MCM0158244.1 50S ribosomal protein L14 [endosymbiont of Metamasius hemipterus]